MPVPSRPLSRPANPNFSSGPCAKRPGWSLDALGGAVLGRSHRSAAGKAKLKAAIDRTAALLGIPAGYRIGIVPASDTGAVEMAMWTLLGARGVDLLAWESFGRGWVSDALMQLALPDARVIEAPYGALPDLARVDPARDVVFTWNGTTSGVRVPDGDWIAGDRAGLTICDATSAVFGMTLPWDKLDVVTFSWQKALGGEAAHGMLVLGPRAVARLESHIPAWPLPKLFRLTRDGRLIDGIFMGETINTPSMLCVEDWLDALAWADGVGGLDGLVARTRANLAVLEAWVAGSDWVAFLAADAAVRSPTSVCLSIIDPWFTGLDMAARRAVTKKVDSVLSAEGVAHDINGYRDAPPGLRIWCGATVEAADLAALTPWLDWAYAGVRADIAAAA